MQDESFFLKAAKCEFEKQQVEYLGLILDGDTITPDPVKMSPALGTRLACTPHGPG
jgi:hypothetical protein